MTVNIAEEFTSIAASFSALLEGLAYIDEDVADKLAVEFSEKLVKSTRAVYAEMAGKISVQLAKPKKNARRRKVMPGVPEAVVPMEVSTEVPQEELASQYDSGSEELPYNERSFLGGPVNQTGLDNALDGVEVTNRAMNYPPGGGGGDRAGKMVPQRRMTPAEYNDRKT